MQADIGPAAANAQFVRTAVIRPLKMRRGARVSAVGKLQCGTPGSDGRQLWAGRVGAGPLAATVVDYASLCRVDRNQNWEPFGNHLDIIA